MGNHDVIGTRSVAHMHIFSALTLYKRTLSHKPKGISYTGYKLS